MFNYREDDKFTIDKLCEEFNYSFTTNGNTITIENVVSINKLRNSVVVIAKDSFKKLNSKEEVFFYCQKELKDYFDNKK